VPDVAEGVLDVMHQSQQSLQVCGQRMPDLSSLSRAVHRMDSLKVAPRALRRCQRRLH
jgi:hypothetical protein